jgi:hypothetical protein
MRIAELVDFITGVRPDFHSPDAALQPGDRFGRYDTRGGWTYVEVSELNDGHLHAGCVYAKAFSRRHPTGREGSCHPSQLGLRIDDDTWLALRAAGWPPLGAVLGIDTQELPGRRPLTS